MFSSARRIRHSKLTCSDGEGIRDEAWMLLLRLEMVLVAGLGIDARVGGDFATTSFPVGAFNISFFFDLERLLQRGLFIFFPAFDISGFLRLRSVVFLVRSIVGGIFESTGLLTPENVGEGSVRRDD